MRSPVDSFRAKAIGSDDEIELSAAILSDTQTSMDDIRDMTAARARERTALAAVHNVMDQLLAHLPDTPEVRFLRKAYDAASQTARQAGTETDEAICHVSISASSQNIQVIAAQDKALRDKLTGLPNRAAYEQTLRDMTQEAHRSGSTMCLAVLDIDHFKSFNDTYGHDVGDAVLKSVGETARAAVRGQDFVGRYGGEEFVLLLPNTTMREAAAIAERVRAKIARQPFHHPQTGETLRPITVSMGIDILRPCPHSPAQARALEPAKAEAHMNKIAQWTAEENARMFKAADRALYKAKSKGRNRVIMAPNPYGFLESTYSAAPRGRTAPKPVR